MITKDQLIDALLSGWNDDEQGGRFDTSEETFNHDLESTFGFSFGRDRIEEDTSATTGENQRYYYQYRTPLYLPGSGDMNEDVLLVVRIDTPVQKIYLYRIED